VLGLFFDLRNPQPWAKPWPEFYARTLDSISAAEQMGLHSVWVTEHHLFDDGYMPQPLTFLSAIAARTSKVVLGTAVTLPALRPPALVAEEAAVVDQLSGGRLQLGFGAGYSPREYQLFGADVAKRYSLTDTAAMEVRRLLDERITTPPAAQNPFPIWMGYQGPQGARRAGRMGTGLLSLDKSLLEPYRQGLEEGGHDVATARTGGMLDIIVADDPESAFERILPHYAHQLNTYRAASVAGSGAPAPKEIGLDKLRAQKTGAGSIPGLRVLTVDEAKAAIAEEIADAPVQHVYLWGSIAAMPDDLADRHIELVSRELAPHFSA